jgi:hypothetical protein
MSESHESKYRGKVRGILYDYEDDKLARLEINPSNAPKPKKKKGQSTPWVETRSETVSVEMARALDLGDEVSIITTVSKIAKRPQPQVR